MSTTDETKPAGKSKRRKAKVEGGKKVSAGVVLSENPAPAELQSPAPERQPRPVRAKNPKPQPQPVAVEQPVAPLAAPVEADPVIESAPSAPISAAPPAAAPAPTEQRPTEPKSVEPEIADAKPVEAKPAEAKPAEAKPAETTPSEITSVEPAPAQPLSAELVPVSLQTLANAYRDYTRKSIQDFGSFVEQLSGARSLDKAMTVQTEFVKRAYETSVAESQKICELHNRLAKQALDPFKGLTGKRPAPHGKP